MGPGVIAPGKVWRAHKRAKNPPASMGPGVIAPGKLKTVDISTRGFRGFNGAGSDRSRKGDAPARSADGVVASMGPGVIAPGKHWAEPRRVFVCSRFNGAGSDRSRKASASVVYICGQD